MAGGLMRLSASRRRTTAHGEIESRVPDMHESTVRFRVSRFQQMLRGSTSLVVAGSNPAVIHLNDGLRSSVDRAPDFGESHALSQLLVVGSYS